MDTIPIVRNLFPPQLALARQAFLSVLMRSQAFAPRGFAALRVLRATLPLLDKRTKAFNGQSKSRQVEPKLNRRYRYKPFMRTNLHSKAVHRLHSPGVGVFRPTLNW